MHFLDSLFWFFPELIDFLFFRCKHKYHNIDVVDVHRYGLTHRVYVNRCEFCGKIKKVKVK